MKSRFCSLVGLVIAACAWQGDPTVASVALDVRNVGPAFLAFWEASYNKPEDERVELFMDLVVSPNLELFGASVLDKLSLVGEGASSSPRDTVAKYLKDVAPYVPRMRAIVDSVKRDFAGYARNFSATFPDFAPKSPVYFTVSLFNFDGATRSVGGHTALLFGIDGIARFHAADENLKVLFDHELFHQYHDQIWPQASADDLPLWMSLWEEGLATYVSQRMNPDASEGQVLLDRDLAARVQPVLPRVAKELLDNLDSSDPKEYAAFFYFRNERDDLPPRSGYFVGLRVAQALGSTRTLQQLAALRGPELEDAVRRALRGLAVAQE